MIIVLTYMYVCVLSKHGNMNTNDNTDFALTIVLNNEHIQNYSLQMECLSTSMEQPVHTVYRYTSWHFLAELTSKQHNQFHI